VRKKRVNNRLALALFILAAIALLDVWLSANYLMWKGVL
jgi:hypothetical protein